MRRLASLWAAGMLLRRLRGEAGVILLIVVLVASTSFAFAAAPRLFNRVADDAIRYAVRTATPTQRSLGAALTSTIAAASGEGVKPVQTYGDRVEKQFPASVLAIVDPPLLRITTVRMVVADPPSYDTRLSLRYQDGLPEASRLVEGRWPADRGTRLKTVPLSGPPTAPGSMFADGEEVSILEAAISKAAATEVGVHVGDRLSISLDGSDSGNFRAPYHLAPTQIEIVGLFEAIDESALYWSGDTGLLKVVQLGQPDNPVAGVTAYVPAEMYPNLVASRLPFRYEWRFQVNQDRLDASDIPRLQSDLRRLGVVSGAGGTGATGTVEIRTGLPGILEQFAEQRARTETVLSMATLGPLGLAAAAIAMVALLLVRRRRATIALARGRGASARLLLGAQLWESVIIAGAAAVIGFLLAITLIPARATPLSAQLAIAIGAMATVVLVATSWSTARRSLGNLERDEAPVLRVSTRRLVIEGTIVFLAVGATLLLRQRGLGAASAGGATGAGADAAAAVDPLLAAVPVLAGLAAGIVALRLYPLPIRALGWLAAKGRDFVPVLGLRTIGRHPGAANLPILVLLLTAAFGAFASTLSTSIDRGQLTASYLDIGADFRVERIGLGTIPEASFVSAIDGVEAVAAGLVDQSASFASLQGQRASIYLAAIDPAAYATVLAGSPADARFPQTMLAPPATDVDGALPGSATNPIPALLSNRVPTGSTHLDPGDTFRVAVVGQFLTFRVMERRETFPGIDARSPFVIVPLGWAQAAFDRAPAPSVVYVKASRDIGDELASAVTGAGFAGRVISRYDTYSALHDAPLEDVIATGYTLALIVAAIYMAMAIVGALVLSAAGRTRDLAYLRTLGVTSRQSLGLMIVEHGPPVVLALIPGILLGIAIAILVQPGLGLDIFVGIKGVPLYVDWVAMAGMAGALIAVVAGAVVLGTWLSRRGRPTDALRMGEQ